MTRSETFSDVIDLAITRTISNENIVMFLLEETSDTLRIASSCLDRDEASAVRIPGGHGHAGRAIASRAPEGVVVPQAPHRTTVIRENPPPSAVLAAPLFDGERPVPALVVSRPAPPLHRT